VAPAGTKNPCRTIGHLYNTKPIKN